MQIRFSHALGAILLFSLSISAAGARDLVCDGEIPDTVGGEWLGAWPEAGNECNQSTYGLTPEAKSSGEVNSAPASGMAYYIMQSWEAPSPVVLNCEDGGSGFICEAFPQGDNISYTWTTTGYVTQPYPNVPSSPVKTLGCSGTGGGGSVTVTVHSPYGVTASATQNLYCGW